MGQDELNIWYTAKLPAGTWLRALELWCNEYCTAPYELSTGWRGTVQRWQVRETIKFKSQSDLIQYELTWC